MKWWIWFLVLILKKVYMYEKKEEEMMKYIKIFYKILLKIRNYLIFFIEII